MHRVDQAGSEQSRSIALVWDTLLYACGTLVCIICATL